MAGWMVYAGMDSLLTGMASILQKKGLEESHALEYSAMVSIIAALLALPLFFVTDLSLLTPVVLGLILLMAAINALAFVLYAKAMRHLPLSVAGPVLLLSPVLATLFAFIFLGERLTLLQTTGIISVVLGAYLLEGWPLLRRHPRTHRRGEDWPTGTARHPRWGDALRGEQGAHRTRRARPPRPRGERAPRHPHRRGVPRRATRLP